MNIEIYKGLNGCRKAKGVAVVIDVFRATTTLACLLRSKPQKILLCRDRSELNNQTLEPDIILFSEIIKSPASFDNSPLKALTLPLEKKTVCLLTQNGTAAFHAVNHCKRVLAASFINLDAVVRFLSALKPAQISLVAIGNINRGEETIEDTICAEAILSRLRGRIVDEQLIRQELSDKIKQRRLDPERPQGDDVEKDLSICAAIGILDVVPEIYYDNNQAFVRNASI